MDTFNDIQTICKSFNNSISSNKTKLSKIENFNIMEDLFSQFYRQFEVIMISFLIIEDFYV